jgi:hypothetical protein
MPFLLCRCTLFDQLWLHMHVFWLQTSRACLAHYEKNASCQDYDLLNAMHCLHTWVNSSLYICTSNGVDRLGFLFKTSKCEVLKPCSFSNRNKHKISSKCWYIDPAAMSLTQYLHHTQPVWPCKKAPTYFYCISCNVLLAHHAHA